MEGENYAKMARERNIALDCLVAMEDWMNANRRFENTAYKGDARKECDRTRDILLAKLAEAKPLLDRRKNNG